MNWFYSFSFLLLLAAFASAAYYFDAPLIPISSKADPGRDDFIDVPNHRKIAIKPKGRRPLSRKMKTTPPPWSPIPYNGNCSIEIYSVSTDMHKDKFHTNITSTAYLKVAPSVSYPAGWQHVLRKTTRITKNYQLESVDNIPCTTIADSKRCDELRHWIYSVTTAETTRSMEFMPSSIGNTSRKSFDHEKYQYVEKLDWHKHREEKNARPFRKIFTDVIYIRDLCRGPGVNQYFECYAGSDGRKKCQCLRDKRPQFENQSWLKWDPERKTCVAPVETICAIRDTLMDYRKSPIQCEEGSSCAHTTGLDDSYVFCSRFSNDPRQAHDLFRKVAKKSNGLSAWRNNNNFVLVYLLLGLGILSYYYVIGVLGN